MFCSRFLLFCIFLSTMKAASAAGQALPIANGDFEGGMQGWAGSGQVEAGAGRAGSNGLVLTAGHARASDEAYVPLAPDRDLHVSVWVKCEECAADSVGLAALFRAPDGRVLGSWAEGRAPVFAMDGGKSALLAVSGGTHPWRVLEAEIPSSQVPVGAATLHLYLRKDLLKDSGGVAAFDDVAVAQMPAGTVQVEQVVLNGGFESGREHWWGKAGAVTEETASEGMRSLKLTEGFVAQDKRTVAGGRRYRITMDINAESAGPESAVVQLSFRGPGVQGGWRGPATTRMGKRSERAVFVAGGESGWQRHSVVVDTPPGARELLLYLRKKDGTPGAVFYDAVEVSLTDEVVETAASKKRDALEGRLFGAAPEAEPGGLVRVQATGGGGLPIAADGKTPYRISVAPGADVIVLNATGDLADYLQKVTGANFLPLVNSQETDGPPLIIVGRDAVTASGLAKDIPYESLGEDGFVVRSVGQHLLITGAGSRGTMYGVNWFLDRKVGVKWLSPAYTHIPERRSLRLEAQNEVQRPRFAYREVLSVEGEDKRYRARNLLNGESHGPSFNPSPPEIDTWDNSWRAQGGYATFWELLNRTKTFPTNPEWFAGGQVAMMNPAVRSKTAESVIARLRKHPDYRSIWFDVHDMDTGWDMDAASRKFADAHGGKPSAPRLDMMIDVAEQVRAALPDARLAFNPYHWSFSPPEGMSVPDHILVFPMTIHVDYSTPLNAGNNLQLGRDIDTWNRMAKNVLVWDHIANFSGLLQPTPNIYPIGESIQWLATLPNVRGYFAEGSWNTPAGEFAALRAWMIARLLWTPNQDVRALVEEFCTLYYGAAGPALVQYIDLMHEAIRASGDVLGEKAQADMKMYDLAFIREAERLFELAEGAVAGDAVRLKHVRAARMGVDYVALLRRSDLQREAAASGQPWAADVAARTKRLLDTAKIERVRHHRQGEPVAALPALLAVERTAAELPELAKGRAPEDWADYQDLSFNRYGAARIVSDPKASDGAAVRMPGSVGGWLVQFKLDKLPREGSWDVYARVRVNLASPDASGGWAARVGSAPPMYRVTPLNLDDARDGEYRYVKVPGGPFRREVNHDKSIYVQGPSNARVESLFVDRIVAIRAGSAK